MCIMCTKTSTRRERSTHIWYSDSTHLRHSPQTCCMIMIEQYMIARSQYLYAYSSMMESTRTRNSSAGNCRLPFFFRKSRWNSVNSKLRHWHTFAGHAVRSAAIINIQILLSESQRILGNCCNVQFRPARESHRRTARAQRDDNSLFIDCHRYMVSTYCIGCIAMV